MKHFIDLEIKRFDKEEFTSDFHPENLRNHYYLRFRSFTPDGVGSELEFWYPSLYKCVVCLIQLLTRYIMIL